ncbi:MAG: hypothetical protein IEMM0002_0896 [bacterium]|nr:MAG: hypothetical protein IEMM0002_0896 [bacterium]
MKKTETGYRQILKERYEILNNLPVPLYMVGKDHDIKYSNKFFQGKFGKPNSKNSRKCYETLQNKSCPCEKCPVTTALDTGETLTAEYVLSDNNDYFLYSAPVRTVDEKSPLAIGMLINVADHRRMEAKLRKKKYETFLNQYRLTPQEQRVVKHIVRGKGDKKIAKKLGISANTIKRHIQSVFRKIGIHSRMELMAVIHKELKIF